MAVLFSDAFTEASDTAITSHTPNVGTSYTLYSSGSPTLRVAGGLGYCEAGHFSDGGRLCATDNLGVTAYDVQGDFTGDTGAVFWGLRARNTTASAADGMEFVYDAAVGEYSLGSTTLSEAAPSFPHTMLLEVRAGTARGYVNGVLKVTSTVDSNPSTGFFAGFLLGNFSGGAKTVRVDNFSISTVSAEPDASSAFNNKIGPGLLAGPGFRTDGLPRMAPRPQRGIIPTPLVVVVQNATTRRLITPPPGRAAPGALANWAVFLQGELPSVTVNTTYAQVADLVLVALQGVGAASGTVTQTAQIGTVVLTGVAGTNTGTGTVTTVAQTTTVVLSGVAGSSSSGAGSTTAQIATLTLEGLPGTVTVSGTVTTTAQIGSVVLQGLQGVSSAGGTVTTAAQIGDIILQGLQGVQGGGGATVAQIATISLSAVQGSSSASGTATLVAQVATLVLSGVAGVNVGSGAGVTTVAQMATVTLSAVSIVMTPGGGAIMAALNPALTTYGSTRSLDTTSAWNQLFAASLQDVLAQYANPDFGLNPGITKKAIDNP